MNSRIGFLVVLTLLLKIKAPNIIPPKKPVNTPRIAITSPPHVKERSLVHINSKPRAVIPDAKNAINKMESLEDFDFMKYRSEDLRL